MKISEQYKKIKSGIFDNIQYRSKYTNKYILMNHSLNQSETHKQNNLEINRQQLDQYNIESFNSDIFLSKIQFAQEFQSPEPNSNKNKDSLLKTAEPLYFNKKSKPYCGCGQYYSCTSSLYLHIRSKHKGIAPQGTIGGPKGIVKKTIPAQNNVKIQQNDGNFIYNSNNDQKSKIQAGVTQQQKRQPQAQKICRYCSKSYSCNSSLNLHLKRKHFAKRIINGQIQADQFIEQDKGTKTYQCSACGLSYGSKSALGLHFNNKHLSKGGQSNINFGDGQVQKCGCGLIYQSRSALNMHVKKKHDGLYPQGTSEKPQIKTKMDEFDRIVFPDQEDNNIYQSQSQQKHKTQKTINRTQIIKQQRVLKCGCGRNYSCSSALNLHIKKNHNRIVPEGTIGGPRGLRNDDQRRQIINVRMPPKKQLIKTCLFCKKSLKQIQKIFECIRCGDQYSCSKCFWDKNLLRNLDRDHYWRMCK